MEYLNSFFAQQWVLVTIAVILVLYRFASMRFKKLPVLPTGLLIIYLILRMAIYYVPKDLDPKLVKAIDVTAYIALYCAIVRAFFSLIIEPWLYLRMKTKAPKISRDLILLVLYAIVAFIILRTRGGVNPVGLITTSAVLTAVIGLAAQNTLGNLFSGLLIQMAKPYQIGDWIQYHEYTGRVDGIGWESTRLKTFEDEIIIVPNLDISKSVLKNFSLPTPRHVMKIDVGLEYKASPDHVREVLLGVLKDEPGALKDPPPAIRLVNFGDFAITYQMRFFYEDHGTSPDLRARIMNRLWYALKRANIRIPFPARDIQHRHIERKVDAEYRDKLRAESKLKLEDVPILRPLSNDDKENLAHGLSIEEYGEGELIVSQGEAGDSLYILNSGECDVEISTGGRPAQKITSMKPPAFFGEMSLLTGEPRSATVRASTDTTVLSINRDLFKKILAAHPEISESLAKVLAERQENTAEIVSHAPNTEKQTSHLLGKIKSFFGLK